MIPKRKASSNSVYLNDRRFSLFAGLRTEKGSRSILRLVVMIVE